MSEELMDEEWFMDRIQIEVDGILCEADRAEWTVQPMIDIKGDPSILSPAGRQMWNQPPTDAELDEWVKNGEEDFDLLPLEDGPIP